MNIRSIDLQVLIPKATEVSKNQQISDHQRMVQQQNVSQEWQQISMQRQNQIQHAPQTEHGTIKQAPEREKKNGKQQHAQARTRDTKKSEELADTEQTDPTRGNLIDIKT